MPSDVRDMTGDGRGTDDWLGTGELDWGEQPAGARRPVGPSSTPGEPLWPDHEPPQHPDEAIYRRRRMFALIGAVAAVAVVILVAVIAFGGGSDNAANTPPATTAQTTPPPPPPPPPASTKPSTTTTPTTPTTTTPASLTLATGQTLKSGDSGQQVTELQQALTSLGYDTGGTEGNFGPKTAAAVGSFQRAHNLADDGVVGPATVAAINDALAAKTG